MTVLLSILIPVLAGAVLLLVPEKGIFAQRKYVFAYSAVTLLTALVLAIIAMTTGTGTFNLMALTDELDIYFAIDDMGRVFASVVSIVWLLCFVFSWEYMKHEHKNKRYFGFYVIVYGVLLGLDFAGNLVTFYAFYEFMTLLSMPLVLHNQSKEAIMAGLKYMFYSFCGAYMVLFGFFFVFRYSNTLAFSGRSVFDAAVLEQNHTILLIAAFCMIMGFSVKAGSFPLHAWLPTAHPVAPAPASAALSGIIVKAGVLGIIRTVFYIFGADYIRGSWVQTVWMILSLITVFMGSMLAYKTDILKKRLAYSTVSQLSYILFGLSVLEPMAFSGSLLHVAFHAVSKSLLFLSAGAIIYRTGIQRASELKGIGKRMPITLWCFTFASLCLVGIPPTGGFLSKWYLAVGSLRANIKVISILGPIILLVSALLTAGYLLSVTVKGFLPGEDFDYDNNRNIEKEKTMLWMLIPMIILAVLTTVPSIFAGGMVNFFDLISKSLM